MGITLITGATSTLGREIAKKRANVDALIIHGRDLKELEALASELRLLTQVEIWHCDFSQPLGIREGLSNLLKSKNLYIENIIHAAGCLKVLPFRSYELSDTVNIFNVNVFSVIEILRLVTSKPYRDKLCSVVLISALFSKIGDKGNAIYSASKGALNSLIKGLAVEFPTTRFNSIILGAVRTKMTNHLFEPGADQERFKRYLLGIGHPKMVADGVDFLLQRDLWMTGQELYLDGGASIA